MNEIGVKADETVFVGDSPLEDIAGVESTDMKRVFVPSQFYALDSLRKSQQKPTLKLKSDCDLCKIFQGFVDKIQWKP